MRKIFFVLFPIILISCNQKQIEQEQESSKDLVPEPLTYEVVNSLLSEILKANQMQTTPLAYEAFLFLEGPGQEDYMNISKMDTLFSKEDVTFIKEQLKARADFSFKKELLKNAILIPNDSITKFLTPVKGENNFWKQFERSYGNKGYYSMSKPLFSADQKTAIISYGFHCGRLCGGGSTVILKKIDGKWKHIEELQNWAS